MKTTNRRVYILFRVTTCIMQNYTYTHYYRFVAWTLIALLEQFVYYIPKFSSLNNPKTPPTSKTRNIKRIGNNLLSFLLVTDFI